jgi:hypothetical protein
MNGSAGSVGAIPGYALKARGGLEATMLFYKVL